MSDTPATTVGKACLATYQRVLDECKAFNAARLYLLKLEVGSWQDGGTLKDAHDEFIEHLKPHYPTPSRYFTERSFISLVAAFELFLQDTISIIVLVNPKKVGQVEFRLSEILDAASQAELIRRGIDATLTKIMYKKPMEYLSEAASLLSIDEQPLRAKWPFFVEAKARRDLGVHNGWRCNSIYLRKVGDAGLTTALTEGESTFPVDEVYLKATVDTLAELASLIIQAVIAKHPASMSVVLP